MQQPLVSIIIPAYNAAAFLQRAVDSLLAQTHRPLEIILVDDGSTDATPALLAAYAAAPPPPGITFVALSQPNAGVAAARNRGLAAATAPFVAFLDADDEYHPERLARTLAPLLADPSLGMVYAQARRLFPDGRSQIEHAAAASRWGIHGVQSPPRCHTCTATLRRTILDQAGHFDATLPVLEDIDLFVRVAELAPVLEIPEPLATLHDRPASLSHEPKPDRNAAALLRVTEKALQRARTPRSPRRARAEALARAGIQYLDAGRNLDAARHFAAALVRHPRPLFLRLLLQCLVPPPLIRLARRLRNP